MKQIYYTQCPIGYGLGASNGFQIKQLSPGYPVSGDFRHLGMRAQLPGSRTLAPPSLRYRREGGTAEVAWLTPRAQEYHTERGLWGRPGGHFAHGLRLEPSEMAAISNWPAGLFDQGLWRRTDQEPTRDRLPDAIELNADSLRCPPTFAAAAPMAAGEDEDRLARLLTSLAFAVREGRTLFLIDQPERLGDRVALLTFAFPSTIRADLTFSTYHDRPEELPGFRLQGTIAAARPNRAALVGLGLVADLVADTFEPHLEPSRWASTLARWLITADEEAERAWTATDARCASAMAGPTSTGESIWSDAWLNPLFDFHSAMRDAEAVPAQEEEWSRFAELSAWAGRSGLGGEWSAARGPSWWREAADSSSSPRARAAFLSTAALPEAWRAGDPLQFQTAGEWGEVVARWFDSCPSRERLAAVVAMLRAAPGPSRAAFLPALLKGMPAPVAEETLGRLKSGGLIDRALLLPMEVRGAVIPALGGQPALLRDVLTRAVEQSGGIAGALTALAAEVDGDPRAHGALDPILADVFEAADRAGRDEASAWALSRDDAPAWLGPYLRRVFSQPDAVGDWLRLRDRTNPASRHVMARTILQVTQDPGLPDEAFRWGVEEVLLTLPERTRPDDPKWAEHYLRRTASGLDLVKKLFSKDHRNVELRRWLAAARDRGDLSPEQFARIKDAQSYARALATGDAKALMGIDLPHVPSQDRGPLLGQILSHVGGSSIESLDLCLNSCRLAWPDAFQAGAPDLAGLALPLAGALAAYRAAPEAWLDHLVRVLGVLGLTERPGRGFEPDSLAAHVVAATTRWPEPHVLPWKLRELLLHDKHAWRILAVDARRDLEGVEPSRAPAVLIVWDHALDKPRRIARFYELMLNAGDGRRLAALVAARAADLCSGGIGSLSWWDSIRHDGSPNDLREGFARLAPMKPLPSGSLPTVQHWMRAFKPIEYVRAAEHVELMPIEGDDRQEARRKVQDFSHLSALGLARWRCLEALSEFRQDMADTQQRWLTLLKGKETLPLGQLGLDDRHKFLAWLIQMTDDYSLAPVERLARWLVRHGSWDVDRLKTWQDDLEGDAPRVDVLRPGLTVFISDLQAELKTVLREAKESARKAGASDSSRFSI